MKEALKRYGILMVAWLPFFVVWVLFAMMYARMSVWSAVASSAISMGTATVLGAFAWHITRRWPWPLRPTVWFYFLHVCLASAYAVLWICGVWLLDSLRRGALIAHYWNSPIIGWQLLMGVWIYGLFAGVSYAVQTRDRLHEKETLALRAEALVATARMDALRARLNPHFLFNALHTLSALVKFRPETAEKAIERLGDMLRYTLKEDGRELVEFGEEYEFTRQYVAFEQLRYEDRLKVEMQIDSESYNFDVPPFSIQTLAENAVHHAISVRAEGGSIWIKSECRGGRLTVTVRDDGPGEEVEAGKSHQFGLRSLRERLRAAFGSEAALTLHRGPEGFEARLELPARCELHDAKSSAKVQAL
jgi:hypothetical protein